MTLLSFRPATEADQAFLLAVYASTRADELAQVDWSPAQKTAFVAMQFAAQQQHYRAHYTDTDYLVVLWEDQACGRFYLARWPGELRVVELSILPSHQNLGIGTQILQGVLQEAAAAAKPVQIHVEQSNRAHSLYQRLGFVPIQEQGAHLLMRWQAPAPVATA